MPWHGLPGTLNLVLAARPGPLALARIAGSADLGISCTACRPLHGSPGSLTLVSAKGPACPRTVCRVC